MNVGELEELLAKLPADMPVHISAGGGCRHVTVVDKQDRRRMDPEVHAAFGGGPLLPDGRHPAALVLRAEAGAPLWFAAWAGDVPFRVTGRWPATPPRRRLPSSSRVPYHTAHVPSSRPRPGQPGIKPTLDEVAIQREQDRTILDLALSGRNGVQIAADLGVDKSTVTRTLQRVFARTEQPRADELRALWDLRIEAALGAIWTQVLAGELAAVTAFCRLEERAAKLHGLDQQTVKDAGALADALLADPEARRTRALQLRDDLADGRRRREAEAAGG